MKFRADEWAVVLPRRRTGLFSSPYLEPATIVERETGSDLEECCGCGQFREDVQPIEYEGGGIDVCRDCRSTV